MSTKKSVVVVGGGVAGSDIARTLSQKLDPDAHTLTLVTARPFFIHLPALVRMTTTSQGKLEDTAFIPYDKIFINKNGTLKVGRVASIEEKGGKGGVVILESDERIAYDVLVLAPGSHWSGPLDIPDDREGALAHINEWRGKFENASSVVLAGGGAVGLEYAGEIKDFFPKKKVTIVHSGPKVLNATYPDKYRNRLEKDFRARGVEFIFDDYISNFELSGTVTTRSGKQIDADLIVPAVGGRPNTEFIASLGSNVLNADGRVRVKPTLQLDAFPNIFAAGDVVDWAEQKQAAKYPKHAQVVVANILAHLKGAAASKRYASQPEMIIVTNGVKGGAGFIGMGWGFVLGSFASATLKSKGLLVSMARKGLGMS